MFCSPKCLEVFKKKASVQYITNQLDSIFFKEANLTSNKYDVNEVEKDINSFFASILCVFHSKLFQAVFASVPYFRDMLNQESFDHITAESRKVLDEDEDRNEFLFSDLQVVLSNLLACIKPHPRGKNSLAQFTGNPALETFAFIHGQLERSVRMMREDELLVQGEISYFGQYYPEFKNKPVEQRVFIFLMYMFITTAHQMRQDQKENEEPQMQDPKGNDSEQKDEGAASNPESDTSQDEEPDDSDLDSEAESSESQEIDEEPALAILRDLAGNSTVRLSSLYPPNYLPEVIQLHKRPYLQFLNIPSTHIAKLKTLTISVEAIDCRFEIPILLKSPNFPATTFRRLRTHLSSKVTYPYKLMSVNSGKNATLEDEHKEILATHDKQVCSLKLAKILHFVKREGENNSLSTAECNSLSCLPTNQLTVIHVQYIIGLDGRTENHRIMFEHYLLIRRIDESTFINEGHKHPELDHLDSKVLRILKNEKLDLRIETTPPTRSQGTAFLFVKLLLPSDFGYGFDPYTPKIAKIKEQIFIKLTKSVSRKLNFNYETEELLDALVDPQELEKLQDTILEKKGPPTVLIIKFEQGMKLPMLGYYFLRSFASGQNIFTYKLPSNVSLVLSSFTMSRQGSNTEVFLNTGNHTEIFKTETGSEKCNLFSSAQGEFKEMPITMLEPEHITQIVYELQETTQTPLRVVAATKTQK